MMVEERTAKHISEAGGKKIYLCSESCKKQFDGNPKKFGYWHKIRNNTHPKTCLSCEKVAGIKAVWQVTTWACCRYRDGTFAYIVDNSLCQNECTGTGVPSWNLRQFLWIHMCRCRMDMALNAKILFVQYFGIQDSRCLNSPHFVWIWSSPYWCFLLEHFIISIYQ